MPKPRIVIKIHWKQSIAKVCYLIPAVTVLGLVVFVPIILVFKMSLYNDVLFRPQEYRFVGLQNFFNLIRDSLFWESLGHSALWVFGSVSLQFILGLTGALVLNQRFFGRNVSRSLILLPWVIPGVITGLIWSWLYDPSFGVINDLLIRMHVIHNRIAWLSSYRLAMASVIFANVWRGTPFFVIMLLAGLQAIPKELYEAAAVDGVTAFQKLKHITIPLLKPMIVVSIVIRVIWTFNYVDPIWIMTEGGPGNATKITALYTLLKSTTELDYGYGATLCVALFFIMLIFTVLYMKITKGIEA